MTDPGGHIPLIFITTVFINSTNTGNSSIESYKIVTYTTIDVLKIIYKILSLTYLRRNKFIWINLFRL